MNDTTKQRLAGEIHTAIAFEAFGGELDPRTLPTIQALLKDEVYLAEHPAPEKVSDVKSAQWVYEAALEVMTRVGAPVHASEKDPIPSGNGETVKGPGGAPPPLPMPY